MLSAHNAVVARGLIPAKHLISNQKMMNDTATTSPDRYPPQIKYIVGNEACERFSYYGMTGILELYLSEKMKMTDNGATEVLHLFAMAVYFLPLLGGWIADRWLGRYWTILSISLFYCLGHGTLAAFGTTRSGLFTGLALIAFGAGGIKPCVSAFVGDQFRADQGAPDDKGLRLVLLDDQLGRGRRVFHHSLDSYQLWI